MPQEELSDSSKSTAYLQMENYETKIQWIELGVSKMERNTKENACRNYKNILIEVGYKKRVIDRVLF
jgi:hypothetical protein